MPINRKLTVAILFGGRSAEHEVSLQSAKNVINALDKNKYVPILIGIDKTGRWVMADSANFLLNAKDPSLIKLNASNETISMRPYGGGEIINTTNPHNTPHIDVVFPVLHGPFGEDGTIQGLLKLAGIPFVGAGVLGSAIGMDKDVMKRLLRDAHIPTAQFLAFGDTNIPAFDEIKDTLGLPFFIKPANLGSSVGVHKVHSSEEFASAIHDAFSYDRKIVCEEYIIGREIECSVLGSENPIASLPGEVIATHEFYDYEAKYIDENGAVLKIPAELPNDTIERVQKLAIRTFTILGCEGMARVDFFLRDNDEIVVNEINTIPGFTSISMYPKLWEVSGISYTELIDRLIMLALERFEKECALKTTR